MCWSGPEIIRSPAEQQAEIFGGVISVAVDFEPRGVKLTTSPK